MMSNGVIVTGQASTQALHVVQALSSSTEMYSSEIKDYHHQQIRH